MSDKDKAVEHIRHAEELLRRSESSGMREQPMLLKAQVHATLASIYLDRGFTQ